MNPLPKLRSCLAPCGAILLAFVTLSSVHATDYYVDSVAGNDLNPGTSASPFASFAYLNAHPNLTGDNVYLAIGSTWHTGLVLTGSGTASVPIQITSYTPTGRTGGQPIISLSNTIGNECLRITDGSHWKISHLEMCNSDKGIRVQFSDGVFGNQDFIIQNCYFHDMDLNKADGTSEHSCGVLFIGGANDTNTVLPTSAQWICENMSVIYNRFYKVFTPFQTKFQLDKTGAGYGAGYANQYCFQNFEIRANSVEIGEGNTPFYGTTNAVYMDNAFHDTASNDNRYLMGGTTTLFTEFNESSTFANNYDNLIVSSGSTDETFVDLEGFGNNTRLYSNFMRNTAGSGIEVLALSVDGPPTQQAVETNTTLDGNIFMYNGAGHVQGGAIVACSQIAPGAVTGTLTDNVYSEPVSQWEDTNNSGGNSTDYTGFNTGGAMGVALSSNIQNSADNFAGVQNQNYWSYQYFDGTSDHDMTFALGDNFSGAFITGTWSEASGGRINQFDMQTDANSTYWVNRKWTAPVAGTISIRGRILKALVGGSSLSARIQKKISGTTTTVWSQVIGATDRSGYDTHFDGITVSAGDVISFGVNSNGAASTAYQNVSWVPTIVYTSGGMTNLIQDPGFESGALPNTNWAGNEASISQTSAQHQGTTGSYSCLAAGRSHLWGSPLQDITSILNGSSGGQGNYTLSGWAKFASGSDSGYLVIALTDGSGTTKYIETAKPTVDTNWTYLSNGGSINITWTPPLTSAILFFDDLASTTNVYLDNISLSRP